MRIVTNVMLPWLSAMALVAFAVVPAAAISSAKSTQTVHAQKNSCTMRSANGTGVSNKAAKFQVYEGLLKATDFTTWAVWITDGNTPGYVVKSVKYRCKSGSGFGVSCQGRAKICKL